MEQQVIPTRRGPVPVWMRGDGAPEVVVVRGAIPNPDDFEQITAANAAFLHLPGFFSPPLDEISVSAFADAFDQVLATVCPAPVVLVGASVGALVALATASPRIARRVLVEPFLETRALWPLHELMAPGLGAEPLASWARAILGFVPAGVSNRDYRNLAHAASGARVIAGDIPLMPPRPLSVLPSFTSDDDAARLRAAGAEVVRVVGGHRPSADAVAALEAAIRAR